MRLSFGVALLVLPYAAVGGGAAGAGGRLALLSGAVALLASAAGLWWAERSHAAPSPGALYLHAVLDLLLVTVVVHLTGGADSPFAAVYILVIAAASLLLPGQGTMLVAGLAVALYLGEAALLSSSRSIDAALWLQLAVFVATAGGVGVIAMRLREAGMGQERLVAELERTRLQAADILAHIRSGILTVDERGVLRLANPAASELLGVELERLMGQPVLDELARAAPHIAAALRSAGERGVRTTRAEGVIHAGGRSFPVGVTTTVADLPGEDGGRVVTAIFQDLSESKRAEALKLRAQRLEAVAALSASLAHEIKNPLASIRSATEQLAQMAQASGAGEDEAVLAQLITRESDRLARLLSEFLDFARVRVTRVAELDLAAVVRGAAQLAAAHPDRPAGLEVRCAVPERPVVIEGDEDLLHRAVFNLALNAVQASRERGRVTVEVAFAPAESAGAGLATALPPGLGRGAVLVRVTDEGAGIAPEVRDRLFDPFITTKPGGTGLGLPVVHRAIEAHRGLVLVDSDARGTRFTVLLPNRQPAPVGAGDLT